MGSRQQRLMDVREIVDHEIERQQLGHRVDRHVINAANRPHGRDLAQHGENLTALFVGQLVHVHCIWAFVLNPKHKSHYRKHAP